MRKRYYFPHIARNDPAFHIAVTSKTLMERLGEVKEVFKKYADNTNPQSARNILYTMSQRNSSLLELTECASTDESDNLSSETKSSEETSSPEKRKPSDSCLKRKHLTFGDSAQSDSSKIRSSPAYETPFNSPSKKSSSSFKESDLDPNSHDQPQSNSMEPFNFTSYIRCRLESLIEESEKDVDSITSEQGSDDEKMAKKPDSGSPVKEFIAPALSAKNEKTVSKPAKRPKLFDSSLSPIPELLSPRKRAKFFMSSTDNDRMDASSSKEDNTREKEDKLFVSSTDDKMVVSSSKGDNAGGSSSQDCNVIATFQDKDESLQKFELLFNSIPLKKDGGFEIDLSSEAEDTHVPTCTVSLAGIEHLVDDPIRVESIRKAVDDRLKICISPKKSKELSPSKKKGSNYSRRRSRRGHSPGKDKKNISKEYQERSCILSNPNVLAYLKLGFKSVLTHRNKCLDQIHKYLEGFKGDVNFLYYYAANILLIVKDIPIEGKAYVTTELRDSKDKLITNATEISSRLRSLTNNLKAEIQTWARDLKEIRILNDKNALFLSTQSGSLATIEFLRKYESDLQIVWKRMDRRVFHGDRLRTSLLEISVEFVKLTKDFAKYLTMVDLMKPSTLTSSEAEKRKLRVSWC